MNKKISNLTVEELKDIIREVVSEELMKRNVTYPSYVPTPQPYYCPCQPNPYQQQTVWATTNTIEDADMLKRREKYSINTILEHEGKIRDRGKN